MTDKAARLYPHIGDCPFCETKTAPIDAYVVRNFIGVSIKAICANEHHWTRQIV